MEHVKVVIGANFGDEGKGMMTHYFSQQAEGKVLNVLHNGGIQRGQTARGHVFHCFGSGTLDGADTYYDKPFIANPLGWLQECDELGERLKILAHPECRMTTPFDMLLNQAVEKARGKERHGSCGLGIFETIIRDKTCSVAVSDIFDQNRLYEKLKLIRDTYTPSRMKELGVNAIEDCSIDPYMVAAHEMSRHVELCARENAWSKYDTVIYEGGQGLLLDQDNTEYWPHLTPSSTGSKWLVENLPECDDTEICYVTRSYMTRHGAGRFDTECRKEDINPDIVDTTNVPNEFQETLRYGYLDLDSMTNRILADLSLYRRKMPVKCGVAVTQLNYTDGKLCCCDGYRSTRELGFADRLYLFNKEA